MNDSTKGHNPSWDFGGVGFRFLAAQNRVEFLFRVKGSQQGGDKAIGLVVAANLPDGAALLSPDAYERNASNLAKEGMPSLGIQPGQAVPVSWVDFQSEGLDQH